MAIFFRWHSPHRTSHWARILARFSSDRDQMLATLTVFLAGLRNPTVRLTVDPHQRHGPFSRIQVSRRRHMYSSWYWRRASGSLNGTHQWYQGGRGGVQMHSSSPSPQLDPTRGGGEDEDGSRRRSPSGWCLVDRPDYHQACCPQPTPAGGQKGSHPEPLWQGQELHLRLPGEVFSLPGVLLPHSLAECGVFYT